MVRIVSGMSAGEPTGHPKSELVWTSSGHYNSRMGTSLCISYRRLCNTISWSNGAPQHLSEECGGRPVFCPEIFTDQGTVFMSCTLTKLYKLLGIKSVRTSVYHPQTDVLVERFTLKTMIHWFAQEYAKNWHRWLELLLFVVREVPQASTGFSPFELLHGCQPHWVLNKIQYVMDLRAKLHTLGQLSMENLLQAQGRQSWLYNRETKLSSLQREIKYSYYYQPPDPNC